MIGAADQDVVRRAATLEEIQPLTQLCKQGKLYDVQEWIRQGGPIALPVNTSSHLFERNPLYVAIDRGFHSLVSVLLEAGAPVREQHHNPVSRGSYIALDQAVGERRADLVELLFEHGAAVADTSMRWVIENWDPEVVELFLARGASLTAGWPIAWGLLNKIRPTLGLVKRFGPSDPHVMRQANLALRHHAADSPKWVALTLWAGADPWEKGDDKLDDDEEYEPYEDGDEDAAGRLCTAVDNAVSAGKDEILAKLLEHPAPSVAVAQSAFQRACWRLDKRSLDLLLAKSLLGDAAEHGSQLLRSALHSAAGERDRGSLEVVGTLAQWGAKWLPADDREIATTRRTLMQTSPRFVSGFIEILQEHAAARRRDVEELLRTEGLKRHLGADVKRVMRLVAKVPE